MLKESEKASEGDQVISNDASTDTFVKEDIFSMGTSSFPISSYEESKENIEIASLQREENNNKLTQEVDELEIQDKSCSPSPISPTANYREVFSAVVAKSKKSSNKFSVKQSETWRDEMAKEERVLHLRKTWKLKKLR